MDLLFQKQRRLDGFQAKGMNEVREKLNIMNLSDGERKKYERFLENLHTEASITQTLTIEAEERVREDERKKGKVEMAIKCIKKGYSNSEIIDLSDLTNEEIDELRKLISEGKA